MAISAKDVKELRDRTGLGMMSCKKALTEANGDTEAAMEILRKELKGKMDDRTDRAAGEGVIAVARDADAIAMVEINSETDFVARHENFLAATDQIAQLALAGDDGEVAVNDQITQLVDDLRISTKENVQYARGVKLSGGTIGSYVHHNRKVASVVQVDGEIDEETLNGLCQHVAAYTPVALAVDEAGIAQDMKDKALAEAKEEAIASGKPEEIAEKIATGKYRKWADEHTLLGQAYVKDPAGKQTLKDVVPTGATIKAFVRYAMGG